MGELVCDNSALMKEWDWEENENNYIYPDRLLTGSNKKVAWKCEKGHKWKATVVNRAKGRKCPYCANKYILKGNNDLKTTHPLLAHEWNYEKNVNLDIEKVTYGSEKKAWWKCKLGHEWEATISSRTRGVGCPYCSNRKVLCGYNDLASQFPNVADEWHYEKNGALLPSHVLFGSNQKVWWRCRICGYSWKTQVGLRTRNNTNCPKCEDELKKIRPFQREIPEMGSSLFDLYPQIMKEWAYDLNGEILPTQLKRGSGRKVWWRCEKGHEWKCPVDQRTLRGTGCPICNKEYHVSFPEKAIAFYLSSVCNELQENYRPDFMNRKELDMYLPEFNLAVEYDGEYAHKKVERDIQKDSICEKAGIYVIHIRQVGCPQVIDTKMCYFQLQNNSEKELDRAIKYVLAYIGKDNIQVDVERDRSLIYEYMDIQEKKNSLQKNNPELAKEWHDEKNGYLKPLHVAVNSNKKVWWRCKVGHVWQAQINSRSRGNGCPYCAGKNVIIGENDLGTTHPKLTREWNYEKNTNKFPENYSKGSEEKVWWKCELGHEWQAVIYSRVSGTGCPICAGNELLDGYNELASLYPDVANEWDYEKNNFLTPKMVHANARKKVWWKCVKGHSFDASIYHRTGEKATGCPICNNRKLLKGYNDLATCFPTLANEWNYDKNNCMPTEIITGAAKKVWWKCEMGHEWEAMVSSRCTGVGCPICAGKIVVKGYNDLATLYPDIADEWDYEVNGELLPILFSPGSNKTVGWICRRCEYRYKKIINQKVRYCKCPKCKN